MPTKPLTRDMNQPSLLEYIGQGLGSVLGIAIAETFIFLNNPTDGAYYQFDTNWNPTGSFEIEFNFATSNITTQYVFEMGQVLLVFNSANTLSVFTDKNGISADYTFTDDFADGRLHSIKIQGLIGTSIIEVTIDNYTGTKSGNNPVWDFSGTDRRLANSFNNSSLFAGILSRLRLTDLTLLTNSLNFILNSTTSNAEVSNGVTLSYINILQNTHIRQPFVSDDADTYLGTYNSVPDAVIVAATGAVYDPVTETFTMDGTSAQFGSIFFLNDTLDVGYFYRTTYEQLNTVQGGVIVRTGQSANHTRTTTDGIHVANDYALQVDNLYFQSNHPTDIFIGQIKPMTILKYIDIAPKL